ncbi:MAG: hypothetical protein LBD81_00080 [Holosporaceae bacterium]|nr:hypothetical protein [Holosporaceae bacterium]
MPQLEIETFASQIFWVAIGFFVIYLFVSRIAAPKIESAIKNREHYISDMTTTADGCMSEARDLEINCKNAEENAALDSYIEELTLMSSFREQSIREKEALQEMFSKKTKVEYQRLRRSCDDAYAEIMSELDESLLKIASKKILDSSIGSDGVRNGS